MARAPLLLASCLSAAALLSVLREGTGASVGPRQGAGQDGVDQIFMREPDAWGFLRKRGKRSSKSREEAAAESRQQLWADALRREQHEEQRGEFENFAEEQHDEQRERSREAIEQWRQWHYDGLYPPYLYNRHHV